MVEGENNEWLVEVVSKVALKEAERINRESKYLLDEAEIFRVKFQDEDKESERELKE